MTLRALLSRFLQPRRHGEDAVSATPDPVVAVATAPASTQALEPPEAAAPIVHPPLPDATLSNEPGEVAGAEASSQLAFAITAHIQGKGDKRAGDDGWAGGVSGWGWVEGFTVTCDALGWRDHVSFQAVQRDGTLSPAVEGGAYCGTRGKMSPLHGFVINVTDGSPKFAGLHYEGVFQDKFSSGLLAPGTICVSPTRAPLLAMRLTTDVNAPVKAQAEASTVVTPRPVAFVAAPAIPPAGRHDDGGLWDEGPADLSLIAHVAGWGDTPAGEDGWAGDAGGSRLIEGFSATHAVPGWSRELTYRAVLPSGDLGPAVKGGDYCGTRGKAQPLHGFQIETREGRKDLAGITYAGVFRGGYRTQMLSPGDICAAPDKAPLLSMRITLASEDAEASPSGDLAPEKIRLVIWDLDETFWGGTLTEGGVVWREENAQIVRELALRGIISSICSKNDQEDVLRVLDEHGMREHFVFNSINWDAKGPRLAAMIKDVQLRAPSVLFIDDNPLNRAEAAAFVPGLNVRSEQKLADLLQHSLLQGKPDPERKRLAQYRLLEHRHADRAHVQGDTREFLRASQIVVRIEHDIEPHIDRAVELINRTNQLNFTKSRLAEDPDDAEVARGHLRDVLGKFNVQAGLLHVSDKYGDYGFCGLYVTQRAPAGGPRLLHFTFSCRILGMGIETWLYRLLQRPALSVVGRVLADVFDDSQVIDWISNDLSNIATVDANSEKRLRYVLARGACDMRAVSHYFAMIADEIIEEFDTSRAGQTPVLNHSLLATQIMSGLDPQAIADFAPFGFVAQDFNTILAGTLPPGPAVWLLGFSIEQPIPIYQHRATGALLPAAINGLQGHPADMMAGGAIGQADRATIAHLREKFTFFGRRPDERVDILFRESLHRIFSRADKTVRVFVLLANTHTVDNIGNTGISEQFRYHNEIIADIAGNYPNVELLDPQNFMTAEELATLKAPHHFDRIVYYRIFRHISQQLKT